MHLPRSVFSRKQLDLFLWLLQINSVESVPSTKTMTTLNNFLQGMCGVETVGHDDRLRHRRHMNASQILARVSHRSIAILSRDCI